MRTPSVRVAAPAALALLLLTGCTAPTLLQPVAECDEESTIAEIADCNAGAGLDPADSDLVSTTRISAGNAETVQEYVDYVITDLDSTWSAWFAQIGLSEPYVSYDVIQPDETWPTLCDLNGDGQQGNDFLEHDTPNAFYCHLDGEVTADADWRGTIWLPETTMAWMWSGLIISQQSTYPGDFAAAIVVAHEFGHHVWFEMLTQFDEQGQDVVIPSPKNRELIADCFAGNWMYSAYTDAILEAGDVDEAVAAMEAVGDFEVNSPQHHGTPDERREALLGGFEGVGGQFGPGDPWGCVAKYWQE